MLRQSENHGHSSPIFLFAVAGTRSLGIARGRAALVPFLSSATAIGRHLGWRIESPEDAVAYVRNAAAQFGIASRALLPEGVESSLAGAELEAAKDPGKLISDDHVAEAFNFLSEEFRVANPRRLTGADILLYRGVKASMYPHLYSPKSVDGSRPVGALIMLDTLICEGGIMDGVRKAAQRDRPPGSLKIDQSRGAWAAIGSPDPVAREYQRASLTYFARLSPSQTRSFADRLTTILALAAGS